jgi:hypothetical protein
VIPATYLTLPVVLPLGLSCHPLVSSRVCGASAQEVVIDREDNRLGTVAVHLPRVGYRVTRA